MTPEENALQGGRVIIHLTIRWIVSGVGVYE
jgi:hypothetical protein